jgi:hypothetical protein
MRERPRRRGILIQIPLMPEAATQVATCSIEQWMVDMVRGRIAAGEITVV